MCSAERLMKVNDRRKSGWKVLLPTSGREHSGGWERQDVEKYCDMSDGFIFQTNDFKHCKYGQAGLAFHEQYNEPIVSRL